MQLQLKYKDLINLESFEEFELLCTFSSYITMNINQNIELINELIKYSEYLIKNQYSYKYKYEYINNDIIFKIPIGFTTICNVILYSSRLNDLIRNSKFQKHIILSLKSTKSIIKSCLIYILLMHMFKKYPDMHKLQFNINKKFLIHQFSPSDVQLFFSNCLKEIN